jgi:flavorubredoxin
MAISTKYGKIDIPKIADDEPVFILRAQDRLAEHAIDMYRSLAASHGSAVVEKIQTAIDDFSSWSGSKKLPD